MKYPADVNVLSEPTKQQAESTSKSTQPYQRGRTSITGLMLKLQESM